MKITLISAATFPSDQGIRTISSVLKKAGQDVKIIFLVCSEDYSKFYHRKELNQMLSLCKDSDLIGSNSYASTAPRTIQILKFFEKNQVNIPIVLGGIHAKISPENCIKYADIVCIGEGEETILELTRAIEQKKSIKKIKNLGIWDGREIIKNPVSPVIGI